MFTRLKFAFQSSIIYKYTATTFANMHFANIFKNKYNARLQNIAAAKTKKLVKSVISYKKKHAQKFDHTTIIHLSLKP